MFREGGAKKIRKRGEKFLGGKGKFIEGVKNEVAPKKKKKKKKKVIRKNFGKKGELREQ